MGDIVPMKHIKIRQATVEDAGTIACIHIDSWRANYRGLVPDDYLDGLDYGKRELALRDWLRRIVPDHIVVEVNGIVRGFCDFGVCRDTDMPDAGEVWGIYIAPDFMGQGLGRMLMEYAEKRLFSKWNTVALWVVVGKDSSIGFYEHLGYRADGKRAPLHVGGEKMRMVKIRLNN